ncbi:MAG: M15 family metallopeptidase [Bacilli bacterium]|nr:M15 family metallopeptidase [Bacilli bacterium]MDD4608469.1 M15 family metallopeptidase [Bacilli bacterium]
MNYDKKKRVVLYVIIGFAVITAVLAGLYAYKMFNSNEYELKKKGYNEKQINTILKLDQDKRTYIFNNEYNPDILKFYNEKYFIMDNVKKYINYKKDNKDKDYSDVVAIVNVGADEKFYTNPVKTDIEKGKLMLVNKFNYLPTDYEIEDLVTMNLQFAFNDKQIKAEAYEYFKEMARAAKDEGLTILANTAYRDNEYQSLLYNNQKNRRGTEYADSVAARPGHSEHETGLAIDVSTMKSGLGGFAETPESTWMKDNAHRFGFILRYPEGKEHLTGFNYEPWHYRYVGLEDAGKINELDITFDEYYAFYIK